MEFDDVEIIDPETMHSTSEKKEYSHEQLVMRSTMKCLDAGSKEMVEGYFNEKLDKAGNLIRVYVEDTRNVFIQSVKILLKVMEFDLDKEANIKIGKTLIKLEEDYKDLCSEELKNFFNAPPIVKKQRLLNGIVHRKESLNKQLPFYQDYISKEVDAYLKIFGVLNVLAKRMKLGEERWMDA